MKLPPTFFDLMAKARPHVLTSVEAAVKEGRAPECPDELIEASVATVISDFLRKTGFSYQEFLRSPGATSKEFVNTAKMVAAATRLEFATIHNFLKSGKKTFYFTDGVSFNLLNTSLNVTTDNIRLPYDSCLFVFSSKEVIDTLYKVHRNPTTIHYDTPVSVFVTRSPVHVEGLVGDKFIICVWHARPPNIVHFFVKREIFLKHGWKLEDALKTDWSKLRGIEGESEKRFTEDGVDFFRLILNSIMYLSSKSADVREKVSEHAEIDKSILAEAVVSRKRKLDQTKGRYSQLPYCTVGESVFRVGSNGGTGKGGQLLNRITVRGHWRMQAHGERHSERKPIWVEPYQKGPELADLVNKPYLVK